MQMTVNAVFFPFFLSFFFLLHYSIFPFAYWRFFSIETSAIDLKLKHNVENDLPVIATFFWEIWWGYKLDPSELKMESATPIRRRTGRHTVLGVAGSARQSIIGPSQGP